LPGGQFLCCWQRQPAGLPDRFDLNGWQRGASSLHAVGRLLPEKRSHRKLRQRHLLPNKRHDRADCLPNRFDDLFAWKNQDH
jgi:hypothetical protein